MPPSSHQFAACRVDATTTALTTTVPRSGASTVTPKARLTVPNYAAPGHVFKLKLVLDNPGLEPVNLRALCPSVDEGLTGVGFTAAELRDDAPRARWLTARSGPSRLAGAPGPGPPQGR